MDSLKDIYAVILAGGSGTRFWPVSRQAKPKQFLALGATKESLIQATARRITPLLAASNKISNESHLMVVTNSELSAQVTEHVSTALVLVEPFAKNTAASIGLAAIAVARLNPEGIMIVLPADHSVADEAALRGILTQAVNLARSENALVTVGIRPDFPNTAYGYIKRGQQIAENSFKVDRFFEKPNLQRATDYCNSGEYYWNSGMFVWKASAILAALREHMPQLAASLTRIDAAFGSAQEQSVLELEFARLESISIDFGVLEHDHNCMMIAAQPFGWNDVGSWDAWAQHFTPDAEGNISSGNVLQVQSSNCIVYGTLETGRTITLLGLENLVVVDTPDALLLCDRSRVQDVKLVVAALKKEGKAELL